MSIVKDFDFTDSVSGNIRFSGIGVYTASTGWAQVLLYRTAILNQQRGFMQFETGSYFSSYIVTSIDKVELLVFLASSQPALVPLTTQVLIGNWIGSSLDPSASDYNGGNLMIERTGDLLDNTYYDLSADGNNPTSYIALSSGIGFSTTDIALRGTYNANGQGENFNTVKAKCQLRVTFTGTLRPTRHLLSLTGVGR